MDARTTHRSACRIRVRGQVQAVGFRPHVWRIAHDLGLAGTVANDGEGVIVHAEGAEADLAELARRIVDEAPPLARILSLEMGEDGLEDDSDFRIVESGDGPISTGIVPDAATCAECLAEVMDPADRRYGHAFANCTHCGPRFSIIRAIPYDRARTSMGEFPMCDDCRREYENPADRRFHAQPIACPKCGPRMWLHHDRGGYLRTTELLAEGRIVAIKGIGGFHLACDALNAGAVAELRRRKQRDAKPFALMAADVETIARFCRVGAEEEALLRSPAAPIVLLKHDGAPLPAGIAPDQDHFGWMLPYTPMHHFLLCAAGGPLVMTSGNRSDEPQVTANHQALSRLAGLADDFLLHDRDIVTRIDDSVMAVDAEGPMVLRRARGLAPAAIPVPERLAAAPPVLALGGELKVTACLLREGEGIVTQHVGDLEDALVHDDYRRMIAFYRDAYRFEPAMIAVDAHPDYLSTKLGEAMAAELGVPLVRTAHHHAHMASCMAENGIDADCHAIVLDGLGMGADGTLWGGEVLRGGLAQARRLGALPAVPLPGGGAAMRQPWRNLVAHLQSAFGEDWQHRGAALCRHLPDPQSVKVIAGMAARGLNSPQCSSAGRVFDAVAAALGVHAERIFHEGQAAMALESMARPHVGQRGYAAGFTGEDVARIDWAPMWDALGADIARGTDKGIVAARFHAGFCDALAELLHRTGPEPGSRVILSGGVMQNRIMRHELAQRLRTRGFVPVHQHVLPANDGGLSLGQAAIAAACWLEGSLE